MRPLTVRHSVRVSPSLCLVKKCKTSTSIRSCLASSPLHSCNAIDVSIQNRKFNAVLCIHALFQCFSRVRSHEYVSYSGYKASCAMEEYTTWNNCVAARPAALLNSRACRALLQKISVTDVMIKNCAAASYITGKTYAEQPLNSANREKIKKVPRKRIGGERPNS